MRQRVVQTSISDEEYKSRKKAVKKVLRSVQIQMLRQHRSSVIVFEGFDASGKGGCIKRLCRMLDARAYRLHQTGPPSEAERETLYLRRFFTGVPDAGRMAIFDRSWYGRCLVERVEQLIEPEVWRRSYAEIRSFEETMVNNDIPVLKFWLEVTPEKQKERLVSRYQRPLKQWKLSQADLDNLTYRCPYEDAIDECIRETSTKKAPWMVIPANDKKRARITIWEEIAQRLLSQLEFDLMPDPMPPGLKAAVEKTLPVDSDEADEAWRELKKKISLSDK